MSARFELERRERGLRKFRTEVARFWTEQGARNWIARRTWSGIPSGEEAGDAE